MSVLGLFRALNVENDYANQSYPIMARYRKFKIITIILVNIRGPEIIFNCSITRRNFYNIVMENTKRIWNHNILGIP